MSGLNQMDHVGRHHSAMTMENNIINNNIHQSVMKLYHYISIESGNWPQECGLFCMYEPLIISYQTRYIQLSEVCIVAKRLLFSHLTSPVKFSVVCTTQQWATPFPIVLFVHHTYFACTATVHAVLLVFFWGLASQ